MMIIKHKLYSGAADASGNATATLDRVLSGIVRGVDVMFDSGSASTTDIDLKEVDGDGNERYTFFTLTDSNTDSFHIPSWEIEDELGPGAGTNELIPLSGAAKITVAGQNEGVGVTVFIYLEV